MKKMELAKAGLEIIVSVGVGAIVGNAIKATTPSTLKGIGKISVALGSLVLTGIASDLATKYTDDRINEAVETVKGMVKETPDNEEDVEMETEEE